MQTQIALQAPGQKGVSIIVLTRDNVNRLGQLLQSFFARNTLAPVEWIVLDHGATDDVRQVLATYATKGFLRHVRRSPDHSLSASWNYGATKARHPFLLFLHDDVLYTADALPPAVARLERDPTIGAVGVRLDESTSTARPGGRPRSVQQAGIRFVRDGEGNALRPERIGHPDRDAYLAACAARRGEDFSRVPAVTGAFLLCRKSEFLAVDGFCETYRAGLADIDLCLRLRRDLKKHCWCLNTLGLEHADETAGSSEVAIAQPEALAQEDRRLFQERWGAASRSLLDDSARIAPALADPPATAAPGKPASGPGKVYVPQVDCLLYPIIKREVEDLIRYFINVPRPTRRPKAVDIVVSIDLSWDREDARRIEQAIRESSASDSVRNIRFIACDLTPEESIYIRKMEDVKDGNIPKYGLKSGPNLQFFTSLTLLLKGAQSYSAVLLQETDTTPLRTNWLDVLNASIEKEPDALQLGAAAAGNSGLSAEIAEHLNGNGIYCLGNPNFPQFLRSWEELVVEVCKTHPWHAYDVITAFTLHKWAHNKQRFAKFEPYLDMYRRGARSIPALVNRAGPLEREPEVVFKGPLVDKALRDACVLHQRVLSPYRDLCRFIINDECLVDSNVIGHDDLWQFPAITEKHAYRKAKSFLHHFSPTTVYFGFPWATLIDSLLHKNAAQSEYLLKVLELYRPHLEKFDRVVTVCQHIMMLHYQYLFDRMGVTDIFWTHAIKDQPVLPRHEYITIHPFPLFPVQIAEQPAAATPSTGKKYLYSYIGAKPNNYYLTNSRRHIIDALASAPRGYVRERGTWHFQKIVYDHQILQRGDAGSKAVEQSKSLEFLDVMRDSIFSLCPSGSGPNTIRLWESIGLGVIPVVLADTYLAPGNPELWEAATVTCPETLADIQALPERLEQLQAMPGLLQRKRQALKQLWLLYGVDCFIYDIISYFLNLHSEAVVA